MAKKTKTSTGKKVLEVIAVILGIIIIAGCIVGILYLCGVMSCNNTEEAAADDLLVVSTQDEGNDNGISLTSISSSDEYKNSRTINAALSGNSYWIEDDEVYEYTFDWSLDYADPEDEWAAANSIEDYLTFTVSDDTYSCTLSCSAAFESQIILTCKLSQHTEYSASCTVDYLSLPYLIEFGDGIMTWNLLDDTASFYITNENHDQYNVTSLSCKVSYTAGTLGADLSSFYITACPVARNTYNVDVSYLWYWYGTDLSSYGIPSCRLDFSLQGDSTYLCSVTVLTKATSGLYVSGIVSLCAAYISGEFNSKYDYDFTAEHLGIILCSSYYNVDLYNGTCTSGQRLNNEKLTLSSYYYDIASDTTLSESFIIF